jgi:hypothetical protein
MDMEALANDNPQPNNGQMSVLIAGKSYPVNRGDPTAKTLKVMLANLGIDSFALIIDGREIMDSKTIPATFGECASVEVQRSVKPGNVLR